MKILYLCDKKACGDECPNKECTYTSNIQHAINFSVAKFTNNDKDENVTYCEEKN